MCNELKCKINRFENLKKNRKTMGCDWAKIRTTNKVVPTNNSTNQSVSTLPVKVVGQQNTGSFGVTLTQSASNVNDHSENNNENVVIDKSIDQSILIPLENLKSIVQNESTKHEELVLVDNVTNYPMQIFEQMSTHETTNEHLPQRINSGTSNKRSISANSQQWESEHHSKKINDEMVPVSDKSIAGKDPDNTPSTINDRMEKKINDDTVSISDKSIVEDTDNIADTINNQIEKKINDSIQEPTITGNSNLEIFALLILRFLFL